MLQMLMIAALTLAALAALIPLFGLWRRRRAVAEVARDGLVDLERGVTAAVVVCGTRRFYGFEPGAESRVSVDVALGPDRLVVVSSRGTLVDARRGVDGGLRSARCTGPGRLVLEGELGAQASWRMEIRIERAEVWGERLAGFAVRGGVPSATWPGAA